MKNDVNISIVPYESNMSNPGWDFDKIIYDYPLARFRESGYTKEFLNYIINSKGEKF